MGLNFNFFGDSEHRVFNYRPRFDRNEEAKDGKEYAPGSYIRGSLRDGNYQQTRGGKKITKIIGLVGLVCFFIVLVYIARFYMFILK